MIDWAKARKELDFVILRSSVGRKTDPYFVRNAQECNIPFGVYHYVNAGTAAEAEAEAEYFYHAARGYSDSTTQYAGNKKPAATTTEGKIKPLFWAVDIEDDAQTRTTTEPVTQAFLNRLRKLGAEKIGLYANMHRPYMSDKLVKAFDWIWVPRYGKDNGEADDVNYPPKYPCDLWQYTSAGKVNGISCNVDLSKLYGEKTLEYFTGKKEKTMTAAEKRQAVIDKYTTILGRNIYSQARRDYCFRQYTDGKYYSDCSSSVSYSYKEAGYGFGIMNTVGMYQATNLHKVDVVIKNGQIQNPEVLRIGDMLLFAGTDNARAYAGYVGHVEMVYAIDGANVTLCGHGSGNPKTKDMKTYCKTRYNAKSPTPIGNQGLIKVVRYILDDGETPTQDTATGAGAATGAAQTLEPGKNAVTITGGSVYIRKGPGTSYGALMISHKGDLFEKLEADGWTLINYGGALRWISSKYVADGKCSGGTVNIRKGPSTSYASIGYARLGDRLNIVNATGWIPILIDGVIYWVSAKYAG